MEIKFFLANLPWSDALNDEEQDFSRMLRASIRSGLQYLDARVDAIEFRPVPLPNNE